MAEAEERLEPLYRVRDGGCHLYSGKLLLETSSGTKSVEADLWMKLDPAPKVQMFLPGPAAAMMFGEVAPVAVARDASLEPPADIEIEGSCIELAQSVTQAGEIAAAKRFVIHVIGELHVKRLRANELCEPIEMDLPGWSLRLHPQSQDEEEAGFAAVIDARPEGSIDLDAWQVLQRRLFLLLSFLCSREIGIGPTCGLAEDGGIVWVEWGDVRVRRGRSSLPWCPPELVCGVLPELSRRFSAASEDEFRFAIVDRAIGFMLACDSNEAVVDVRVPMACSGLESVAWAMLQREELILDPQTMQRLSTAARLRLFLVWAGIPTEVPDPLPHLRELSANGRQKWWGGPELLVELRNQLVHPSRRLADSGWPSAQAIADGWYLSSWYLTLGILRMLEYEGRYWSRLPPHGTGAAHEDVPWVRSAEDPEAGAGNRGR